jgi:hypothetical protein
MINKYKAILFCSLLLLQILISNKIHSQDPVLWWKFDTITNASLTEEIGNQQDNVTGYRCLVQGVKGKALKLDGYTTRVVRDAADVPVFTDGMAIEGWIALQTLPWNWSGIVSQGTRLNRSATSKPEYDYRVFFGVDAHGHLGFKISIQGQIYTCISEEKLPLLSWNHVAATYDSSEGMKIFLNGELVSEEIVQGSISRETGSDLLLGMNIRKMGPVGSERKASADIHSDMIIHGLLDEIKIYDYSLGSDAIREHFMDGNPIDSMPLQWNKMPSGPEKLNPKFDAFFTRLWYTEEWEAPWRVANHPDILVHFDQIPVRLIFWRGTGYGGVWVTENGIWMGDQSLERAGPGKSPMGCSEHMSDKQNRYSNIRIIEKSDARIVIHWRYAVSDILYQIFGNDNVTGWGEWAEEYYYIYPDGISTRHQTLWTENLSHEWQETIVINQPGTSPEDNIALEALTLVNMDGEGRTYSWEEGGPDSFPEPEKPNIQMVNLKSKYKPFIVFEPDPEISPFNASTIRPKYSNFPWWNHWPVAQLPNDGRRAFGPDRPSHSSLSQSIEGSDVIHDNGDGCYEVVMLTGMSADPADSLVTLARSWNHSPEISIGNNGSLEAVYSKKERAFLFTKYTKAFQDGFNFTVHATDKSPLLNPAFVIKNWGESNVRAELNGKIVEQGENFRTGFRSHENGTDLIIWFRYTSKHTVKFVLTPICN